jgi:GR25 family glycosyltransferase involved in LPS biosynthesis
VISWAVVGHEARLIEATELAKTLDAPASIDDGTLGAGANHIRAWELTKAREAEWAAVCEDDAQPVQRFTEQAEQALAVAPEPVVSFYLGRTRPVRWQDRISRALVHIDDRDPHWLTTTHVLHAVAIALHTDLRDDWLDWAHGNDLPPDERMTAWCIARGHKVAYSWPSLVDHADGPTLVRHGNTGSTTAPRKAWRTGTRNTWTPTAIPM